MKRMVLAALLLTGACSDWKKVTYIDPMTDASDHYVEVADHRGFALRLGCIEGHVHLRLYSPRVLSMDMTDSVVTYRMDDRPAQTAGVSLMDHTIGFQSTATAAYSDGAIIEGLRSASRLRMSIPSLDRYQEEQLIEWPVRGGASAINWVQQNCQPTRP